MSNKCSNVSCAREATRYFQCNGPALAKSIGNELKRTCEQHALSGAHRELSREEFLSMLGLPP